MCVSSVLYLFAAAVSLCIFSCSPVSGDYVLSSLDSTPYGWEGRLKLSSPGPYAADLPSLSLSVWFETECRLRVTLRDATAARWEIPADILHIESKQPPQSAPVDSLYHFSITQQPFGFAVSRKSTGAVLFNTSGQPLYYQDQYLQIGTVMPADANVYGLGERIVPFKLPLNDYTIWSNDVGNPIQVNLYGHHSVYHRVENTGDAHAVAFWNSNAVRTQRHLAPHLLSYVEAVLAVR